MRAWLPVLLLIPLLGCSPESGPSNANKLNSGRPDLFGNAAAKKPTPASEAQPEADAGSQPTSAPNPTRVIGSPASSAGEVPLIPTGRWTDLKPCTPLLELKRDKQGAWAWHHGEKTLGTDGREAEKALDGFAKHKHHGTGWQGTAANGVSRNLAVVLVDAEAPARLVCWFMECTMAAQIGQVAVGLRGMATPPRDAQKCAQAENLGASYLVYTAPVDERLSSAPSVPKEEVACGIYWSEADWRFSYTTMIGARGRKPVLGSTGETGMYLSPPEASQAARAESQQNRDRLIGTIAEQLHGQVVNSGGRIERLRYISMDFLATSSVPWLAFELAWRACEDTRRRMQAAGSDSVSVAHPWEYQVPEPPPPEQPPERDVEFPRDEPPTEYPTEDPRITED